MGFHGELLLRIGTAACAPALTIDIDGGVDGIHHRTDLVHRLDVVDTHQVEAEPVDMVLVDPVFHALQHKLAHHRLVRGSLVAAARAVAILSVSGFTIEIVGIGALEVGVFDVIGVVIYHVEDHADASIVEGFHHLLELADAYFWGIGIGGVATLWHVVVHRVVAPVVFVVAETCLIHRTVVVAGQDVDRVHTKLLQVTDGPGLCQCHELAGILRILAVDGEVTMVHLVDHKVGGRLRDGVLILRPSLRIGLREVDDGASLAVHTHGFGEDTRALALSHVEGIELTHQVALHGGLPLFVGDAFHLHALLGLAAKTCFIDTHHNLLRIVRCKEGEHGLLRRIDHFLKRLCCYLLG